VVAGLLMAWAAAASGQEPESFEYVVKFVCGKGDGRVVAKGTYFTAINVHNPNERRLGFRKKFAIALPSEKAGRVTKFFDARLGPDEAFEVDCPDIFKHTQTEGFLKGFAVIESERELDVVAVYTAAGSTDAVETMDVERVEARRRGVGPTGGQPDLIPLKDPQAGFCKIKDGKLIVTVKNQGTGAAGASTTRVDFPNAVSTSLPTPSINAGNQVDVAFPIPAGCFQPDCSFRITVDSASQVGESDETNNTASGNCIG
jgi:hypothetical protein